jgi:hypothetical protein
MMAEETELEYHALCIDTNVFYAVKLVIRRPRIKRDFDRPWEWQRKNA